MKLSTAIERGRFLLPETNPSTYCGCALAMALVAVGKQPCPSDPRSPCDFREASKANDQWKQAQIKEWPWIKLDFPDPDFYFRPVPAVGIISHMFTRVHAGRVTLDSLIDWVRSVEPPEENHTVSEEASEYATV